MGIFEFVERFMEVRRMRIELADAKAAIRERDIKIEKLVRELEDCKQQRNAAPESAGVTIAPPVRKRFDSG